MKQTFSLLIAVLIALAAATADAKPLKVFILAGQSNMEGPANMTDAQKQEYLKTFEAKLISPAEVALWKRGASNAGYHYLGCAKTFALMGKAFAVASLEMEK